MFRAILATAFLLAASTEGLAMDSLSQYTWKKRVLVVFGEPTAPKLSRQIALFKSQTDDLAERDMVVLQVSRDKVSAVYGDNPDIKPDDLRAELQASDEFQLVLVGKDGGVKLRSKDVVADAEIFDLIDRMPMRQGEQK